MDAPVPRSKVPLLGLILLILVSVVTGVVVGGIVAAVDVYLHFYLILVFAIFMGAIAGGAVALAARLGRVRSGAIAVIFAFITGLIMYGSYWYGNYLLLKQQVYEKSPETNRLKLDAELDLFFAGETGQPGFVGFVMYSAKKGISITSTNNISSSTRTNDLTLVGPVAYGYWVVEILIILGVGAAAAAKVSNMPFCDRDNRYFITQNLGRVPKDSADQFMLMAKAGDWSGAMLLIDRSRGKVTYPYLEVKVEKCPACNTNPLPLSVVRKISSKKNAEKVIFKATVTPAQYSELAGVPVDPVPVSAY